jgi:ESCRT-II complex subunit VPS36
MWLQLADFLVPHVERQGGVLTLPDVYCLFNRARGSELVSPADVLKARPLLLRHHVDG